MPGRVKSDTLLTLSRTGGACRACRHANQGTVDLGEGPADPADSTSPTIDHSQ